VEIRLAVSPARRSHAQLLDLDGRAARDNARRVLQRRRARARCPRRSECLHGRAKAPSWLCDLRLMRRDRGVALTSGHFVWGVVQQDTYVYASDRNSLRRCYSFPRSLILTTCDPSPLFSGRAGVLHHHPRLVSCPVVRCASKQQLQTQACMSSRNGVRRCCQVR
jgi:hypothetical protein